MREPRIRPLLVPALLLTVAAGCAPHPAPSPPTPLAEGPDTRGFTILAVNDVYRIGGADEGATGGIPRIRTLRSRLEAQGEVLFLHGGDFLFPSLLSRRFDGRQMVDLMNLLDGSSPGFDDRMFVTVGNHETEKTSREDVALLRSRIEESEFGWLVANLEFEEDGAGHPLVEEPNLQPSALLELGGVTVGVFGVTTVMTEAEYIRAVGDPVAAGTEATTRLRAAGAEVVVGLTHLNRSVDARLAAAPNGPDLIIGGHDHDASHELVAGRWILKADAEARTATVARVELARDGSVRVRPELVPLDGSIPPDETAQARVQQWEDDFARQFCPTPGCLDERLGLTNVPLHGEELRIRGRETNLGNWVADMALGSFAQQGAQIAFLNAGGLRLNQDLPAGTVLTRRHVEELFAYPSPLRLLRIDGATLQRVASHAVEHWPGVGWWLQISGFAFRHDPTTGTISDLSWPDGRCIAPDDSILAVTVDYLVNPERDQDGYTMLSPQHVVAEGRDLKEVVIERLRDHGDEGIRPVREGRICQDDTPCLATGC